MFLKARSDYSDSAYTSGKCSMLPLIAMHCTSRRSQQNCCSLNEPLLSKPCCITAIEIWLLIFSYKICQLTVAYSNENSESRPANICLKLWPLSRSRPASSDWQSRRAVVSIQPRLRPGQGISGLEVAERSVHRADSENYNCLHFLDICH